MPGQFVLFVILRTQRLAGKNFSSDILRVVSLCTFPLFQSYKETIFQRHFSHAAN